MKRALVTLLSLTFTASLASAQLPAFPGAEGFGAGTTGGRGGAVRIVTTLATSGPGSLQAALDAPGPSIIVFEVSGVIDGDVLVPHGDVTIAGQTAPGAGITIHGHLYTDYGDPYGNIILRHLRVRPPGISSEWPGQQHDSIQFSTNHDLIFDHVSASHGIDETVDLYTAAQRITVQWSAITYSVTGGGHPEGDHNKGLINGPGGGLISIHHNLFAHHRNRTPALADGPADVINNVVYNGREGFVHHNPANGNFNLIGNVYIDGPSASLLPVFFDPENDNPPSRYFVSDNLVHDPGVFEGRFDNPYDTSGFADEYGFACCGIDTGHFVGARFDFRGTDGYVPVTVHAAADTEDALLAGAGAWPRDVVDRWAIDDITTRGGSWGDRRPADWLEGLTPGAPPVDGDRDGISDAWENTHGLDPDDSHDHGTVMPSGYTAIEEYINELADALVGGVVTPPPVDAGPGSSLDAGAPRDGGRRDGGVTPALDGGARRDGGVEPAMADGCGCRSAARQSAAGPLGAVVLLLVFAARARRLRP